jgi:hypothetical protein
MVPTRNCKTDLWICGSPMKIRSWKWLQPQLKLNTSCKELESAWYFNCSVYGKTFDEKRIKFDIFYDINNKIAKRH